MKRYNNYKKALGAIGFLLATSLSMSSCIKNHVSGETQFNSLSPMVLIPEGGLAAFTSQALVFPGTDASDTAYFHVNYAATNVAPADETITLAVDQTALTTYNSQGGDQYAIFPDSIYSFTSTSVTVKKGNNYTDQIPVVLYPSKIDPTKNYMLPISIKTAPNGAGISGNFGTIWYHLIGNPIAGSYSWTWTRFNAGDTTGTPTGSSFSGHPTLFSPDNPTQVEVPSGYYNGPRYVISFTNTAGVLSAFSVSLNPADLTSWAGAGITLTSGPTILAADPVNGYFEFTYQVVTSGGPRTLLDKFYKQ